MQLEAAVVAYLREKSTNTARSYLFAWALWKGKCKKLSAPTLDDCNLLIETLRIQCASDGTLRQRFQVLASIHEYLFSLGLIKRNPFIAASRLISFRQMHQVRPTKLVPTQSVVVLINPARYAGRKGIRDCALLSLLFGGGLRISEAQALNLGDLLTSPEGLPYVSIAQPKAGKCQTAALPTWAYESVSRYVSMRKSEGGEDKDPLFVDVYRGVLRRSDIRTLSRIYRMQLESVGLIGYAPHSARATFATRLKELGKSDEELAEALRHATTTSVRVYNKLWGQVKRSPSLAVEYSDKPTSCKAA